MTHGNCSTSRIYRDKQLKPGEFTTGEEPEQLQMHLVLSYLPKGTFLTHGRCQLSWEHGGK